MTSYVRERLGLFTTHGMPFAVLLIEPERLQVFQAAHGQEAVRSILRVVGHTLKNTLRPTDYLGRWKGNQFLAVLPGCSNQYLENVANRLKGTTLSSGIQWWGDRLSVAVRVVGTAVMAGDTVESILRRVELHRRQITPVEEGGNKNKEV
jgi:diguanylate cyclase (GGDEF)-like protein